MVLTVFDIPGGDGQDEGSHVLATAWAAARAPMECAAASAATMAQIALRG
eukprot:CAMPEP_0196788804 /NCGR_PEP_ID=MMETSP1104-20130614/25570_1 /TAXON_ID=33652 /ORGANISM="Cafeteria sp., Strain Caron Lab Isolate" /LENGTH=49 /DNA_ID= /DNA_START= /DNA_END= /DNA_ORIENTATION=